MEDARDEHENSADAKLSGYNEKLEEWKDIISE